MVCVGGEEGLLTANSILWKVRPPELAPDFDREFSSMTRQRVQHFPFPQTLVSLHLPKRKLQFTNSRLSSAT
jgi:hypothetical protein